MMAQVLEFKLPDLGEGLTGAEIVHWLVSVGDVVTVDQPVVEVETAKAMIEVPCPYAGVVTARFGEEGTVLPVGAPLLTVAPGEPAAGAGPGQYEASGQEASAQDEASGHVLVGYGTSHSAARRRRIRQPMDPSRLILPTGSASSPGASSPGASSAGASSAGASSGSGSSALGSSADGPENGASGSVPVVSPLVRRLARENDLDLHEMRGSGRDGLIVRGDVERAIRASIRRTLPEAQPTARPPSRKRPPAESSSPPRSGGFRVPLRGVRGAVADKLTRSRHEIPDATCWVDADATELLAARTAMNAAGGQKISLLALFARICTAALARHPELNCTVDTTAREIVRLPEVHLGFAAQTDRGLVVPVVRDAQTRSAESLSAEFARLTEAGRSGTLTPGELTGGTFTLNNYGVFGVDGSTPIINHPEAAMLGIGRIVPKPWVHLGELAVRQVVQLSVTFDHRVCDGGTAGGFLRHVADCVEQPAVLLRAL
jgi:2-oxoisovalerate dehydrogenase E2 component (dihydrolipoyl transacylase)